MKFNHRIGDLELRSRERETYITADIIKWFYDKDNKRDYCIVIASWNKDDEGYELRFVGSRPMEFYDYWDNFGKLVKMGYEYLNEAFKQDFNPNYDD